jgi:hypothetical protein
MITLTWLTVLLLVGCICLMASRLNLTRAAYDQRRQEEAEAKGMKLLLDNLTAEQSRQYDRFGYFDVVGSKKLERATVFVMALRETSTSCSRRTGSAQAVVSCREAIW